MGCWAWKTSAIQSRTTGGSASPATWRTAAGAMRFMVSRAASRTSSSLVTWSW